MLVDGDAKCQLCRKDSQGCYWDGVSRLGIRGRKSAKTESAKKGGAAKAKVVVDLESPRATRATKGMSSISCFFVVELIVSR